MPDTRIHVEPERIDDLPLALGLLRQTRVPQIVDAHLGVGHGNRQGLSVRWTMLSGYQKFGRDKETDLLASLNKLTPEVCSFVTQPDRSWSCSYLHAASRIIFV
jgi:hypothetical protein